MKQKGRRRFIAKKRNEQKIRQRGNKKSPLVSEVAANYIKEETQKIDKEGHWGFAISAIIVSLFILGIVIKCPESRSLKMLFIWLIFLGICLLGDLVTTNNYFPRKEDFTKVPIEPDLY